ncbi:hypothetical protein [Pelosinus sp. sgz500959]|uniref:hypothetical protein n=1 Tax=Pelosinus sp. sgz500959 TaxID=3242472 RepID=UPI00366A652D
MLHNDLRYFLVLSVVMAVTLTACGKATDGVKVQLDSGVVNENYQGVAKPVVEKKLKLSSEELTNGIQKAPIKSSTRQQLTPDVQVTDTTGKDKEGQVKEDNAAKPQV